MSSNPYVSGLNLGSDYLFNHLYSLSQMPSCSTSTYYYSATYEGPRAEEDPNEVILSPEQVEGFILCES